MPVLSAQYLIHYGFTDCVRATRVSCLLQAVTLEVAWAAAQTQPRTRPHPGGSRWHSLGRSHSHRPSRPGRPGVSRPRARSPGSVPAPAVPLGAAPWVPSEAPLCFTQSRGRGRRPASLQSPVPAPARPSRRAVPCHVGSEARFSPSASARRRDAAAAGGEGLLSLGPRPERRPHRRHASLPPCFLHTPVLTRVCTGVFPVPV